MGSVAPGSGITAIGGGSPTHDHENSFSLSDDLSWLKGKHSLKFGTLMNRYRLYTQAQTNFAGAWTFNNLTQFLLDNPQQLQINTVGSITDKNNVWYTQGFYGQDEWRATSRLTLNLGLRYEIQTTVHEVHERGSSVRDILRDKSATLGPDFYKNPSLHNFGPRFGFAWDVGGDGKTAIRGGASVLYDIGSFVAVIDVSSNGTPPFATVATLTSGLCFPSCTAVPSVGASLSGGAPSLRTIEW
jgi:outer membrane receptor protein involved in Fe transport